MCPDDGAIDHVGASIPLDHLGQGLEQRIEHPRLNPSPVSAKDAVPFAVAVGQMPPLRSRASDPYHALQIPSIVLSRAAPTPAFRWQKRADQCPFFIRQTNPFAQGSLQK
jgi:hypothetical protein